jgi:hypothetical protein
MLILIVEGIPCLYKIEIYVYTNEGFSAKYIRRGCYIILERLTHKAEIKKIEISVWLNAKTYDVEKKEYHENESVEIDEIIETIEHIHKSINVTQMMQIHLNILKHDWKKCLKMIEWYCYLMYINDEIEVSALRINELVSSLFRYCIKHSNEYMEYVQSK